MTDSITISKFPADDVAKRFVNLWSTGETPNVDTFLDSIEDLSATETAVVLRIDQQERWRRGERVFAESYLSRYPKVVANAEVTLDFIFSEYLFRKKSGENLDSEEFVLRFPKYADALREQIERHRVAFANLAHTETASDSRSGSYDGDHAALPDVPGYDIFGELGRGGMGIIYKARQRGLNRIVALKVLSAGAHASASERTRFLQEAEAVARLGHPNIVQVFDVGSRHGQPYLALEYMEGGNLAQKLGGESWLPGQAAELIEVLARAIHSAHERGIVHRDLKPANVLFTAAQSGVEPKAAVAKISDFGLAKDLTGGSDQTASGAIVGTPSYMAPEQAEGQAKHAGPAADIYALGAILYEMLAGRPPFQGATVMETLLLVRTQDPPSPSRFRPQLPRDVTTVCLKAMAKEPGRRYATAWQLAEDLRHFLLGEPIQARPAGSLEKTIKWVKRRPAIAGLLATVVGVTLVGMAGILTMYGQALAALAKAEKSQLAETEQRELAQANEQSAVRAAKEAREANAASQARAGETQSMLDFVQTKILAAARPEGQEGGIAQDVTLRKAIELALPSISQTFANQPLLEARVRATLGQSLYYLGDQKKAVEQMEITHSIFLKTLGAKHLDTLKSMNNLSGAYTSMHRFADALKLQEEALPILKADYGIDHPNTLILIGNLSNTYSALGRHEEALKMQNDLLHDFVEKLGPSHQTTLEIMTNLAISYKSLGKYAEAMKLEEEILERQKATIGADHPDTLRTMNNLANSYASLGRLADATHLDEKTLALERVKLGIDHTWTLESMDNLADRYTALGRHPDALKLTEEALKVRTSKFGLDHPATLRSMLNLSISYAALNRHADALEIIRDAAARWDKLDPKDYGGLYEVACVRAFMVGLMRTIDKSVKGKADATLEADKAMKWLTKAIAAGYHDVPNLKSDTDLDALRDRDDFKKLLNELEKK